MQESSTKYSPQLTHYFTVTLPVTIKLIQTSKKTNELLSLIDC